MTTDEEHWHLTMVLYPILAGIAGMASTFITFRLSKMLSPSMLSSYKGFSARDKDEWDSKFAHIFHAVVCVLLVWVSVSRTPEFSLTDGPDTTTARRSVLLATNVYSSSTFMFSIGYFLADTFMMLTVLPNSAMMVHHLSAGISLADKGQRKGTQLYLINAVCIVITWVFSRILLFVYLFLHMWEYRDVLDTFPLIVKVCTPGIGIILSCLNLTWFSRILRGALLLLARKKEGGKKDGGVIQQKDTLEATKLKKAV